MVLNRRVNNVILLFLLWGHFINTHAIVDVKCWERHEVSVVAKVNGNPFDVDFSAKFMGPDTTLLVHGFYDGNNIFKIRFMPIKEGNWSYETFSSVPDLSGLKGNIKCLGSDKNNHGIISSDGCNFKYADGTRYYPIGTTSYNWMHSLENIPKTISSLRTSGFNKIRMLLFVQNYDKNSPEPSMFPFVKKGVEKCNGELCYKWDFSQFNPIYFQHIENCIDSLAQIGVEADLILFHPYDKGRWGFDSMPLDINVRYIKYVLARMSSFHNVWWSLANEYDFLKEIPQDSWGIFVDTVVKNDPYRHLLSIHSYTAKYYDYWKPQFTHASIQDQAPVEDFGRAAIVKNIYKKPIIFDEVCYEGNMDNRWGSLSGQEMLFRIWQGLIVGTYVSHSECYMANATDYSKNFLAIGGTFQGESWKRINFIRSLLNDLPNPLKLCDSSWDPHTSTAGLGYYMVYQGKNVQSEWMFELPVKNAEYDCLTENRKFVVDVIDTWNMTIDRCPIIFETGKPSRYRVYDKFQRKVKLPEIPYLLLRITEIKSKNI